jgi:hypothetical protein
LVYLVISNIGCARRAIINRKIHELRNENEYQYCCNPETHEIIQKIPGEDNLKRIIDDYSAISKFLIDNGDPSGRISSNKEGRTIKGIINAIIGKLISSILGGAAFFIVIAFIVTLFNGKETGWNKR